MTKHATLFLSGTLAVLSAGAQVPTITSVSPLIAIPGSTVTIQGSNFNTTAASNEVWFGGTKVTAVTATATEITAVVPYGATYAPLTVRNTATSLAGKSTKHFLPQNLTASPAVASSSFTASNGPNGVSGSTTQLATGDFDADGLLDVVSVNRIMGNYAQAGCVYHNTSTSSAISFANASYLTIPNTGYAYARLESVTTADMNNDGKLDIVAGYVESPSGIAVYLNTSTGPGHISFAAVQTFAIGGFPASIKAADLDGNGMQDVVMGNSGTFYIVRGTASPGATTLTFSATTSVSHGGGTCYGLDITDLDGDGKVDICGGGGTTTTSMIHAVRNLSTPGTLSFSASTNIPDALYFFGFRTADVDSDGKMDLVASNYAGSSSTLKVWPNTSTSGTLSFGTAVSFTRAAVNTTGYSVDVADVNGDGKVDIIPGNSAYNGNLSVLRNEAAGSVTGSSLSAPIQLPQTSAHSGVVFDANNDGYQDLIAMNDTRLMLYQSDLGNPLFIRLAAFNGEATSAGNRLTWTAAADPGLDHFELERSTDGSRFENIETVQVRAAGQQDYEMLDAQPLPGLLHYRLKLVNGDGSTHYSRVVSLRGDALQAAAAWSVAPNPATAAEGFSVVISNAAAADVVITVTDMAGRIVRQQAATVGTGDAAVHVSLAGVTAGTYAVRVAGLDAVQTPQRLVVR